MLLQPYHVEELRFAWCYRVYSSWRTWRSQRQPQLKRLDVSALQPLLDGYGLEALEFSSDDLQAKLLLSLPPTESVAAAISKAKGRVSHWLRAQLALRQRQQLLASGYFACTVGQSPSATVQQYIDSQGEHHGYLSQARPPVFTETYRLTPADESRLAANHSATILRMHLVLASWKRQGVFVRSAGAALASCWRQRQDAWQVFIEKVSFVPDHVHIAIRFHPAVVPATLIVALMNAGQEVMWREFSEFVIRAGVPRLWQPSAYLGSFGDLRTPQIAAYLRNWQATRQE